MTYARIYGLRVVATRAWNHIGPGASPSYAVSAFAKQVAESEKYGTTLKHGNLEAIRNYTDVRDVIRAYRYSIDLEPGIYNVCSNQTVSIKSILEHLVSMSSALVRTYEDPSLHRAMTARFPVPSSEKLFAMTSWEAEIPLKKTLEDVLNFWRERV